jgi:hypothetical protein
MKKHLRFTWLAFLFTAVTFAQVLDQSNAPSASSATFTVSQLQNVGQTFIAGITGQLSQINIRAIDYSFYSFDFTSGDFQLRVFSGSGYSGTVLNTTVFTVSSLSPMDVAQEIVINLSSPIAVVAGQSYTIDLRGVTGIMNNVSATGPTYTNGGIYFSDGDNSFAGSYDLWFKTFVNLPGNHLNFDGVDDYVVANNITSLPVGTNPFTIEAWVKRSASSGKKSILKWGSVADGNLFELSVSPTSVDCTIGGTSYSDGNPIIADEWTHIVVTYSGTQLAVYTNGNTAIIAGGFTPPSTTLPAQVFIGGDNTGENFSGSIDELRIWNVERTASEISANKGCELTGTETNLLAYYTFNQGFGGADNTVITSLTDATTNGNDGILFNFSKTGTTSNFLTDVSLNTSSAATVTTPVNYNLGATASALTATTAGTSLVWYNVSSSGMALTSAPTPSTTTIGSTSYWVASANAKGCESARTEIVVTINPILPATHLNFNGVNDRVELPNESNFDFTSTFSMEAWIRVISFTQEWQTVISKGVEGPRIHRFGVSGFIAFGTGGNDDLASTVSVNDGNWHHIAATCNNGFKSLYVDGVLQGTQIVGTPLVTNNDNVRIGSQIDSYSPIRAFHGDIDDVRIWNIAKTATEIDASKNCELQGNEAGLLAYYKFNQGNGAEDNISITTLTDASGNANNGTLTNFALTGTTSNFLSGSPIVTGTTCTTLNATNFEVANNIKMYPNPTNGIFTIETQEVSTVEVFDMIGKKVYSNKLSVGSSTIDLSNYTNGIYLLTVTNQKGNSNSFKLIKQ